MADSSSEAASRSFVPLLAAADIADFAHPETVSPVSGPAAETVTKWLADVAQLHRSSAGSPEFFNDAARFAVETVGLDGCWVLSYDEPNSAWQVMAAYPVERLHDSIDGQALNSLLIEPVTRFEPSVDSQVESTAQVIAPVLGPTGKVIGGIFAIRDTSGENRRRGVRPLEARMIQVLAESVGVGIARLAQETNAARTRVLLEQAFSPTVAENIQRNPECLTGQLREVSMLFADMRGFTSLAERLSPADCYRLLGEVMETLTQVVIEYQGIVVDYYGDGILALWNAPLDQPHHADLACSAALSMLERLPELTNLWFDQLRSPLGLGIGVHTGPVLVGNAGTNSRLKYGPRGSNVNVASRVQAATKTLETPLLITAATQQQLSNKFFTLRACTARLPGLEQVVELFTVYPVCEAHEVKSRLDQYAHALRHFEDGDLIMAEVLLSELVAAGPVTPARFLAQQAASQRSAELGRRSSDRFPIEHGPIVEIREK